MHQIFIQEQLPHQVFLHFILTCISTGGPATTVTWSRGSDEDSLMPVSDNTSVSVLVNATAAQYIRTLNVTGTELPAVYECSVSNNKPSSTKAVATIDNDGKKLLLLNYFISSNYY